MIRLQWQDAVRQSQRYLRWIARYDYTCRWSRALVRPPRYYAARSRAWLWDEIGKVQFAYSLCA